MSELSEHIHSQYQVGEYDSEGHFTLNVKKASFKLDAYGGNSPTDYILEFVDAGMQTLPIEMRVETELASLSLSFKDASFRVESPKLGSHESPEEMLRSRFHLPLRRAFSADVLKLEVEQAFKDGVGHRTIFTTKGSQSSEIAPAEQSEIRMVFAFKPNWKRTLKHRLGRLRGALCLSPECRTIQRKCEFSKIPVVINGQKINHSPTLPNALFHARVGELEADAKIAEDALVVSGKDWTGAFALTHGDIQVIAHNVTASSIPGLGMSGYLYHDELHLDISQKGLVRDANFEALLTELQEVKFAMLEELALNVKDIYLGSALPYLDELTKLANQKILSPRATELYIDWMKSRVGAAEFASQVNHGARGY